MALPLASLIKILIDQQQKMVYFVSLGYSISLRNQSLYIYIYLVCPSCHERLFTHHEVYLSLPRQVLEYLVRVVEERNPRHIYEVISTRLVSESCIQIQVCDIDS